jgi:hypothetical protein
MPNFHGQKTLWGERILVLIQHTIKEILGAV